MNPRPLFLLLLGLSSGAASRTAAQSAPLPTCASGYVWREAFPRDHVCVTPETRSQAAEDNSQADARRQPGGGAYGPNTCLPGYVWREARRDDLVCVTPETRSQAAADNAQAVARVAAVQPPAPPPPLAQAPAPQPVLDPPRQVALASGSARCRGYANRAVEQFRRTIELRKCGIRSDGRWNADYRAHYDWCVTAQDAWRRNEEKLRDDHLYACGAQTRID